MVIAPGAVSVRELAVRGSTPTELPTKPPNDFELRAGLDVRNAVLMAMRGV
jgi:hypothetical protein